MEEILLRDWSGREMIVSDVSSTVTEITLLVDIILVL